MSRTLTQFQKVVVVCVLMISSLAHGTVFINEVFLNPQNRMRKISISESNIWQSNMLKNITLNKSINNQLINLWRKV